MQGALTLSMSSAWAEMHYTQFFYPWEKNSLSQGYKYSFLLIIQTVLKSLKRRFVRLMPKAFTQTEGITSTPKKKQQAKPTCSFPCRTKLTFSSARCSSCFLAFSTSWAGPLMVTVSLPEPSVGKWMWTPPHSSMMERMKRPLAPMRELWSLEGIETSTSVMLA